MPSPTLSSTAAGRRASWSGTRAGPASALAWDSGCAWLQIYTGDTEPPLPNRLGLAVEPMSCPPDAFNTGTDLVRLEPGAMHRVAWRIFAL